MTRKYYVEPMLPSDDCPCGRKWSDLHCPYCGYATVRATPSRNSEATLANGDTIINRVWNCRNCGQYFDTIRRLYCQAPAKVKPAGRPKSVETQAAELVLHRIEELRKNKQGE